MLISLSFHYRIASGAYYEAHQQLRVIATRYIKQASYDAAAELLAGGATALLRAGSQQGAAASGGDLAVMLVLEVYIKAEWEIDGGDDDAEGRARKSESQFRLWLTWIVSICVFWTFANGVIRLCTERLIELLHEFPAEEPTRKRFIQEMIGWSGRFGPLERGDPDLHHAAGSVYAEGMPCHHNCSGSKRS